MAGEFYVPKDKVRNTEYSRILGRRNCAKNLQKTASGQRKIEL
jgi:hypothetical protein